MRKIGASIWYQKLHFNGWIQKWSGHTPLINTLTKNIKYNSKHKTHSAHHRHGNAVRELDLPATKGIGVDRCQPGRIRLRQHGPRARHDSSRLDKLWHQRCRCGYLLNSFSHGFHKHLGCERPLVRLFGIHWCRYNPGIKITHFWWILILSQHRKTGINCISPPL